MSDYIIPMRVQVQVDDGTEGGTWLTLLEGELDSEKTTDGLAFNQVLMDTGEIKFEEPDE